jgi:DNA-binding MarR family transcriptional regulator
LSKPLLAARLKKMVRLGVLKKVPSRESARVHEYLLTEKDRQLYPVLLALVRWGNAMLIEEARPSRARSMRQAALMNAPLPLRHMYSILRFSRIDALTSSATPRSR